MGQATFSVRMEEGLKNDFDRLCEEFGMSMTTAINVFARTVVRQRRIPFEISAPEPVVTREGARNAFQTLRTSAQRDGLQDMLLDETNEEIRQAKCGENP